MTDAEVIKQKFKDWDECLRGVNPSEDGIDNNSVSAVLYALYWEMGAYESYLAICKDNPKSLLATPLFGKMTAYNYIQVQALRVRRLCESPATPAGDKDTSIYSLRRIVDEMKQSRNLLKRDNICAAYGIPPTKAEITRQFDEATAGVSGSFDTSAVAAGNTHAMLDNILDGHGVLGKKLLKELDKRLLVTNNAQLSEIVYFVDKNIAHSSSKSSRDEVGEIQLRVADMKKVIQDVTEVFYCLNMLVSLSDHAGMVPVGWQNELVNLSKDEAQITSNTYKSVEAESETWKKNGYGLLGL
ncbi:MAG TPA: hypothetical protein VMR45_04825 [Patescibacteria group bacterium]|nr:hypothetical protein [Patescibacteria group bacterium]